MIKRSDVGLEIEFMSKLIMAATGEIPPTLKITGGIIVNVLTGELEDADLILFEDRIVGIGKSVDYPECKTLNAEGMYLVPGLIDSHMHIESTLLVPQALACVLLPHGVTCLLADPHELANVLGSKGIKLIASMAEKAPLRIYFQIPSRVPTAPDLEDSGAELNLKDTAQLLKIEKAVSLGELNYQNLLSGKRIYLEKIALAESIGKITNGHMAGASVKEINACVAAGLVDDHECLSQEEALERLRRGCAVMVREGSSERNLVAILSKMQKKISDMRGLMFCTDDKHPDDLISEGGVDFNVKEAIRIGVDPIIAIQMATINAATHFGLDKTLGILAPHRKADVVILKELESFEVNSVIFDGKLLYHKGRLLYLYQRANIPSWALSTIRVSQELRAVDLVIKVKGAKRAKVRVIKVIPGQIVKREMCEWISVKKGIVTADPERDLLHIAVVERHRCLKQVGKGFISGFGLKEGAIASSISHDHHNLITVGTNPDDMLLAIRRLKEIGGGFVVVKSGSILGELPLPFAGLLSLEPADKVVSKLKRLKRIAQLLGCKLKSPFMQLSFVSLPTVPELGITNRGLVDSRKFKLVDPILELE